MAVARAAKGAIMNKKFSLIYIDGPYGDETCSYDGLLNQPLTVREFIDAIFEQRPDEWGKIRIWGAAYTLYLEYSHGEITYTSSSFNDYLDKKIESFTAHGGWTLMDYTLVVKDE